MTPKKPSTVEATAGAAVSRSDDPLIGQTFVIPPAPHVNHIVTVERRDIEKHKAYWLRCSCGAVTLMGEGWLPLYLNGKRPVWRDSDPLGFTHSRQKG